MSSTTKQQQQEIAGYFRDPKGTATNKGLEHDAKGQNILLKQQDMTKLKAQLLQAIGRVDIADKLRKQIEITVTPEGLRIELIEDAHGTFFKTGSAQPTPLLVSILKVVSAQLGLLPNHLSVEGHTDAQPYTSETIYGNWELSSDRANVARRLMQVNGVRGNQVAQVRGFADQQLRNLKNPYDAANRRISLIVQYLDGSEPMPGALPKGTMRVIGPAAGTQQAGSPGHQEAAAGDGRAAHAAPQGKLLPGVSRRAPIEATTAQESVHGKA